jgi:hypothetical protein
MIFPEIFHFLSVLFLRKFQKLSAGKTVSKKPMNDGLSLAFLIFKTLFHAVLFCFRFFGFLCIGFLCKRLFCWQGIIEIFSFQSKFLFRRGVGSSVRMFVNVLPLKVGTAGFFPVCAVFPALLIVFLPDWFAFFGIRI